MNHLDVDDRGLWAAYKQGGDRAARDRLILRYAPLVQYVAGRVAVGLPACVDRSDLVSYGVLGLIDAIERFEPSRGYRFETYAVARIKGHIVDELRSLDWVPRSVRARSRAIEAAAVALEAELHRSPTEAELATALEMSEDQLVDVLGQTSLMNLVKFDAVLAAANDGGEPLTVGDVLADGDDGPGAILEHSEMLHILSDAIASLTERERQVVSLYYFDGLTLAEIGQALGVTESRVCQIHGKAVLRLRLRLAAAERELV